MSQSLKSWFELSVRFVCKCYVTVLDVVMRKGKWVIQTSCLISNIFEEGIKVCVPDILIISLVSSASSISCFIATAKRMIPPLSKLLIEILNQYLYQLLSLVDGKIRQERFPLLQ